MKQAWLFVILSSSMAMAQYPAAVPKITVAPIENVTVKRGKSAPVQMQFRVAPGFHINSNKPKSELLLPTVVNFDVPTNVSIAKVTYPAGEELTFPFSPDEKLSVYTGDFTVKGLVAVSKETTKGTYRVHGVLRYQACDNRACYPPTSVPLAFDVTVANPTKTSSGSKKNPAQSPHAHN
jgi:hypothetical protein